MALRERRSERLPSFSTGIIQFLESMGVVGVVYVGQYGHGMEYVTLYGLETSRHGSLTDSVLSDNMVALRHG